VLEQVAMRSDSTRIDAAEVKRVLAETGLEQIATPEAPLASPARDEAAFLRPLADQVADLEAQAIAAAMARTGGNKLAASRLLGISRATLYARITQPAGG
jgi:DNA-binding NtrC family response regulator